MGEEAWYEEKNYDDDRMDVSWINWKGKGGKGKDKGKSKGKWDKGSHWRKGLLETRKGL